MRRRGEGGSRRRPRSAALWILPLSIACACRDRPAAPPSPVNVLLVVADTLRADRMSIHGYGRETTPHLARRAAARGVVFENAVSGAGCTFPAVNALLTARAPQRFLGRAGEGIGMGIPREFPTLAERLGQAGYATAAVSSSVIVRRTPSRINRRGGFDAGFGTFDESCERRSGACVTERAARLLDGLPEPFFLYLHYLDPHAPYDPPPWFERRFATGSGGAVRRWASEGNPRPITRHLYDGDAEQATAAEVARLRDLYDEEVRFFDHALEQMLAELDRRELTGRTLVVVVADHGEDLLDHGHWGHCRDLAVPTVLRTPFVVLPPDRTSGARSTLPVSNLDVVPTVLDLAAVSYDRAELEGRSLRRWLREAAPEPEGAESARTVFAAQGTSRVAFDGRHYLLWEMPADRRTLFGFSAATAVGPASGPEADRLHAALRAWLDRVEGASTRQLLDAADDSTRELRALGYL